MATKKIIWKQKTGGTTFDILHPETIAEQVIYNAPVPGGGGVTTSSNAKIAFDELYSGLTQLREQGFVKKEGDTMTGTLYMNGDGFVVSTSSPTMYGNSSITVIGSGGTKYTLTIPKTKNGTLAFAEDIPTTLKNPYSLTIVQYLNDAMNTSVSYDGSKSVSINVKEYTEATTSRRGLMSTTDKSHLDTMWGLWAADGTTDTLVNKVKEVLDAFASFKEGDTIIGLLANKADKTDLSKYVTTDTEQSIDGKKTFEKEIRCMAKEISADAYADYKGDRIVYSYEGDTYDLSFPNKEGTLLVTSDLSWSNLTGKPTSLPPSGTAGGALTGSYPNPQLAYHTVGTNQLMSLAVTTEKITDGSVTDAKLSNSGVSAGTYSAVTVNAKGRVTAGANLFTIGTSSTIPSSVPTNGFYLQEVE